MVRRSIATLLASTFIAVQSPTFAQPPNDEQRAAARMAATEGVQLLEAGKYAEALDRLRRAEALVHAPTHLLYIARAQGKLGQLVEASETYLKIVHEVLVPDAPRPFLEAQSSAEQEVKELDGRIPRLLIRVEGPGAGDAAVTMDDAPLPAPMVGLSAPVDPGLHVVRATAKDGTSAEVRVKVNPGSRETALLTLRAGAQAATAPPLAASPAAQGDAPAPPPREAESSGGSGASKGVGIALMGLGVAGLAVGTAFVFVNRSKRTDANDLCPQNQCPIGEKSQIESLDDQANTAQTAAWIGYGAGMAALAAGLVVFFTAPSARANDASRTPHAVRPWVGVGSLGLSGVF
jgi:hypothetical protein